MKSTALQVLMFLFLTGLFYTLNAQEIQGVVTSDKNIPISGVGVYLNAEKLTETNREGVFMLSENFKFPLNLRLEHPNYFIQEIEITQNNSTFKLSPLSKSEDLDEVILTTRHQDSSLKAAQELLTPTDKIEAEKFDDYSPIGLISAINETPGVFIQSGAISTNRITIRGVGSRTLYGTNKIRAYFNDIPITTGSGKTTVDIFDPEDLQFLDIIKGPKATQYGTNLGGTLLLHSKQAAVGETSLKSNLTLGSYNLIKHTISARTATEKLAINVHYDYLKTDGARENDHYNRNTLLLTSTYRFNLKNEISLLVNHIDYYAQIPSSIGKTAFEEDPSQAAFTWKEAKGYDAYKQLLTGLSFTHRFSENFSNHSRVFYTYVDHYEPRPFNILAEYTHGYGTRSVFNKDFTLMQNQANLNFGGEFYKDEFRWQTIENRYRQNNGNGSLEGDLLSENFEKRNNLNVFATLAISFTEKLSGQLGLNFNKTHYETIDKFNQGEANTSADRNFDPILAPNVNLHYQFTKNLSAFLNISRGFNYPSIEETLTPEGVINPDLGPEKGYNYEVGSAFFLFKRTLHFQLKAYLLEITDLLVAERVGDDEYVGRNAGKTEHKGIEAHLSYTATIANILHVSPYLNAEVTRHKFIDFVDGDSDFSGNKLTGVPDKKINGGITIGYGNIRLNTNFLHVGDIPLNDANELYSDAYTVFNVKASYKNEVFKNLSLEVHAGVDNVTDAHYASSVLINATSFGTAEPRYYYPGMPRNWFGGIKVRYAL